MSEKVGDKTFNYLIGFPTKQLNDNKLPTYREVMNFFIYKHQTLSLTIRQSSTEAISELNNIWSKFLIPTNRSQYNIKKLEIFYKNYQDLKKNSKGKKTPIHFKKIKDFEIKLDTLFDMSKSSEIKNLPAEIRFFFLQSQQKGGYRCTPLVPRKESNLKQESANEEEQKEEEGEEEYNYNNNDDTEISLSQKLSQCSFLSAQSSQSSNVSDIKRVHSDFEDELPKPKVRKIDIMTPEVVATLDRTQITDRQAMFLTSAIINSLGLNINDYNLSHSTIYNRRKKFRKKIVESIQNDLNFPKCLTVHWDGKLLSAGSSKSKVERLPILVTGMDTEKLLGVPMLHEATAVEHAETIYDILIQWNIQDKIKAMCCDTPNVNTGYLNGTCILLEKKLNKNLLLFACRHHMYEIILREVVETAWPATNGPNVPIFKRFQKDWEMIDKSKYKTGLEDEHIETILTTIKNEKVVFLDKQLEDHHPRDDYKELLILCKIFLGAVPRSEVKFRVPGAMHHARWLSKALYSFKMYMFRSEFRLRPSEISSLREICVFLTLFYVEAWFKAPLAIKAPNNDLELFKNLLKYKNIHSKIANAALKKLARHLWYLHEQLVVLALFDSDVTQEQKLKIINSIKFKESFNIKEKRLKIKEDEFDTFATKEICDFASNKSIFIFEAFELPYTFIYSDPNHWESDSDYRKCFNTFSCLKVVNDVAERGVALIEKYNECLTCDEDEKQDILKIVHDHRKNYPNCKKSELCNDGEELYEV